MWIRARILVAMCLLYAGAAYCQASVYQLRIYKLHPGNEQHFHDRFSRQCMPIMLDIRKMRRRTRRQRADVYLQPAGTMLM
jgi:hypothetical protein